MRLSLGLGFGAVRSPPSSAPSYSAEAQAIFAAFSTDPGDTRKQLIDDTIAALKTAGIWDSLDYLHVYAAHEAQAAVINWKNPGTFNATPVSSPTFTTDRGYTGNGSSSYLNTGYNPSTAANLALNSALFGIWHLTNAASNSKVSGARASSSSNILQMFARSATDSYRFSVNQNSTDASGSVTTSVGLTALRRSASNAISVWKNGVSATTGTTASSARPNLNIFVGALNDNGSATAFDDRQIAASFAGAALDNTKMAALYTDCLLPYMQAVGAA